MFGTPFSVGDDVGQWVGTLNDVGPTEAGLLHRLAIAVDEHQRILVEVQLFADSQTPSDVVAVGEAVAAAA